MRPLPIIVKGNSRDNNRNVSSNKMLNNSKNVSSNRQHNRKLNSNSRDNSSNVRLLNNSVSKSSGVQLPLKTQGNNNANNLLLRRIPKVLINRRNRKRSVEGSEMIKLPENSKKYSLFSIN